jgi:hypothetical protein
MGRSWAALTQKMLGLRSDSLVELFLNEIIIGEMTYLAAGMSR